MGVTEYIGNRYVPIFGRKDEDSIEWDNTKPYEPLTIVTYLGNSYTSRKNVPAGVAITNQEYWALTGLFNSQVEAYRSEVTYYDSRIQKNTDDIALINGSISDIHQLAIDAEDKSDSAIEAVSGIEDEILEINNAIEAIDDKVIDVAHGGTGATSKEIARVNLGLAANGEGNVILVKEDRSVDIVFKKEGGGSQYVFGLSCPPGYGILCITNVRTWNCYSATYVETPLSLYVGQGGESAIPVNVSYSYPSMDDDRVGAIAVTYLCVPINGFMKYIPRTVEE